MYRPPGSTTTFLDEVQNCLGTTFQSHNESYILGDFNVHVDNATIRLFMDALQIFYLQQQV